MALSRAELKMVVKECLMELLSEGLGNVQALAARPLAPGRNPIKGAVRENRGTNGKKSTFDPRLDTPLGGGRQPTDFLKETIKRESGGNPIMASILADTAVTTLHEQLSHGDSMGQPSEGSGGAVSREHAPNQQEQFNGNPDDIFEGAAARGDGSSHWADLAFAGQDKKSA